MKYIEKACKTALSHSGIYGWEYVINPYRGCEHGCKYCYAPNIVKTSRTTWGQEVEVKKNIPNILAKELKNKKPKLVGLSSVTDPYQPLEEQFRLTRYCLEQLLRYKFPISIITKSPLILRDIDLLKRFEYSEITISISTINNKISHLIEPKAPSVRVRLEALEKLSENGLNTYAFLGPLLPIVEPEEIPEFVETLQQTGVKTIMVDTLNLKPGIWSDIEQFLKNERYTLEKIRNRLFNNKNYYPDIFNLIKKECETRKINFE
jgi:DNA repair photolyase